MFAPAKNTDGLFRGGGGDSDKQTPANNGKTDQHDASAAQSGLSAVQPARPKINLTEDLSG